MSLWFTPENMKLFFDPASDPSRPWIAACQHDMESHALWVRIPAGFRCDLASIPSWLLWLAPPTGNHQRAAFFHDALYSLKYTNRATADAIMLEIMEQDRVPAWRRWAIYFAIRVFGGRHWRAEDPGRRAGLVAGRRMSQCDGVC